MSHKLSLSVIIPNYNHGHHLQELIPSLLQQSRPPEEIIIVDDASTDNSYSIIQELAKTSSTIKIFKNEINKGAVESLNRALSYVTSEYVTFPSADNFVLPGMYEKSLDILAQYPQAALCCSDPVFFDQETGKQFGTKLNLSSAPCFFPPEKIVDLVKTGKFCVGNLCHTVVVKYQVMQKAMLNGKYYIPELKWHCDFFIMNVLSFRHGICYIPENLAMFRIVKQSYSSKPQPWHIRKKVYSYMIELLNSKNYYDVKNHFISSSILAEFSYSMFLTLITQPSLYQYFTFLFLKRVFKDMCRRTLYFVVDRIPLLRRFLRIVKHSLKHLLNTKALKA